MDFLTALESEIAELERQLTSSPLYVKLRRAQDLRDAYILADSRPAERVQATARDDPRPDPRPTRPFASGTSAAIIDAVKDHLKGRTTPTRTRDLMDMLSAKGIEVGGAVPQNSVSSMLSKSPDIVSHGRAGWTLAEKNKAGDDAPSKDASPALTVTSTPVEPGGEVAHDNTLIDILG